MAESVQQLQYKYHFNCSGQVKEMLPPNKAILNFTLNGCSEKAVLLSKMLTMDGKPLEETRLLQDVIKLNDVIKFDCHVYDKGGWIGHGKDRCNFFAVRAWKNTTEYELKNGISTASGLIKLVAYDAFGAPGSTTTKLGTGWVSELNALRGVLTFDNNGRDERVLFHASKVYFFEKKIGTRQPLTDFLSEGDPVQFEVLSNDGSCSGASSGGGGGGGCNNNSNETDNASNCYCNWLANMVWKGKRPSIEPRDSLDSSGGDSSSDEQRGGGGGGGECQYSYGPKLGNPDVIKGVGMIAKIVNDKSGVLWWVKQFNQLQSVWFTSNKTFLFGTNLANKKLTEIFREGDPVTFLAEKAFSDCPTKWMAKQVLIAEDTAALLQKAMELPDGVKAEGPGPLTT